MKPCIVIDTDVHVSSLPSGRTETAETLEQRRAARAALSYAADHYTAVESPETQRELARIFLRSRYDRMVPRSQRREYLESFSDDAKQVRLDPDLKTPLCRDEKDVPYLNLALSTQAKYLLSYNYWHLGLVGQVGSALIVNPAQMLLLENQGAAMGLEAPTRVMVTDHPDLLRRGHAGSTVFLTEAQAKLTQGHAVEVAPAIKLHNNQHAGLKGGEPEGYLVITDNPDVRTLNGMVGREKKPTVVMSTEGYALMKNHLSANPQQFAADLAVTRQVEAKPEATLQRIRQFTAGRHGIR